MLQPNGYLEDIHIDFFGEIIKRHTNFRPQSVLLVDNTTLIEPISEGSKHLQLLYSLDAGSRIGHWICSYYDGEIINIYDSMNFKHLHPLHENYLKALYRFNCSIRFHDVLHQTNPYECGVFAMAFAMSICFNRKPELERYIIKQMRTHAAKIFETQELAPFPVEV